MEGARIPNYQQNHQELSAGGYYARTSPEKAVSWCLTMAILRKSSRAREKRIALLSRCPKWTKAMMMMTMKKVTKNKNMTTQIKHPPPVRVEGKEKRGGTKRTKTVTRTNALHKGEGATQYVQEPKFVN